MHLILNYIVTFILSMFIGWSIATLDDRSKRKSEERKTEQKLDDMFELLRSWLMDEISDEEAKRKLYKLYNGENNQE